MLEHLASNTLAIDLGAIGTTEILDKEIKVVIQILVGLTLNLGMVTTYSRIIQLNHIIGIAADSDFGLIELIGTERHTLVFE